MALRSQRRRHLVRAPEIGEGAKVDGSLFRVGFLGSLPDLANGGLPLQLAENGSY